MAKSPKKTIDKKSFNLNDFKKSIGLENQIIEKKELTWVPLSDCFHETLKIPGIPRGYFTSFRGFSNTGKSTAIYEAVAGAQKIGDLPVIIETEGHWDWNHAKNIGVKFDTTKVDEETGEILDAEGDFLYFRGRDLLERYGNYDYSQSKEASKRLRNQPIIEDVAKLMNDLLDAQDEGNLPRNLVFLWDSVGSLDGWRSATAKASNNQWNAGSMESAFKSLVNYRVPDSQNKESKYTNTFAVVQKIWLDASGMGQPIIKHKGGEAFFYSPRLIIHYGGIISHGTKKLNAVSGGKKYRYAIKTAIKIEKNQINGVTHEGEIMSTAHGYWNADDDAGYRKEHNDYIKAQLGSKMDDFKIVTESITEAESQA